MKLLKQEFFLQNTDDVAKQLLGKLMVVKSSDRKIYQAIINETESYHGDDPASHASRSRTMRNEPMFWHGGHLYIYLIYGMYYCLNIVTEVENYPSAVLIRGVSLIEPEEKLLDGPGKLCRHLEIDKSFDRINLLDEKNDRFQIYDIGLKPKFKSTPRIGISKNKEALLRFVTIS